MTHYNQNLPSVTIGIPAYNEEANIRYLLVDLLVQKQKKYKIKKIIVSSDASNDGTILEIKKIDNPIIKVIKNKTRKGAAVRQNQIFDASDTDIVVILNADIVIRDKNYIAKLIDPILKNQADLTSSYISELPAATYFEKVIYASMHMKNEVFELLNNGDNIYTCHGATRAFSKKLFTKLRFKNSVGEDAYSYLYAKYHNFSYSYVQNAKIYYKLPTTFLDHERQSLRFLQSMKRFNYLFGEDFVANEYRIPELVFIKGAYATFIKYPLLVTLYFLIFSVVKIKSLFMKNIQDTWVVSKSSKLLRYSI